MINEIYMHDFKAFDGELRVPLRRLTVLVGENNSGKSSILSAIRLLAQTIQGPDDSLPLLFDGPLGDFGAFRDVVNGNHRGRPFRLGLTVPTRTLSPRATTRSRESKFVTEFKYRPQRRETVVRSTKLFSGTSPLLTVSQSSDTDQYVLTHAGRHVVPPAVRGQFRADLRMTNFLPRLAPVQRNAERGSADGRRAAKQLNDVRSIATEASRSILGALASVEVLTSTREVPARTFVHSGSVGRRIGVAGENWANLIALATSGRSRSKVMEGLTEWTRAAGIARDVEVRWLSDRHFELMIQHPTTLEYENVSDVGRGTSQVLPVILGGLRLRDGDTYVVEEPEIHLHPRAQAALGDYFVGLAERGVQSLIETHSEYLILRLQQHIASGRLSPDDVVFYYVEATPDGKRVVQMTLNRDAVFDSELPHGFFPQRVDEARRLVAARSEKRS